jgi:lysozyme
MKTSSKVGGTAGVIACCLAFTPIWEGTDLVAKVDTIGTGHPLTYCEGLTSTDGAVKAGQTFTPDQCKKLFAAALPKYLAGIQPCIHVALPVKSMGSLLDAAYNAGPAAVCRSPMVARMNANDIFGGCDAFEGWYIRASGRVVKGLINRRNGEKKLCLEGATEKPIKPPKISFWTKLIAFLKGL